MSLLYEGVGRIVRAEIPWDCSNESMSELLARLCAVTVLFSYRNSSQGLKRHPVEGGTKVHL